MLPLCSQQPGRNSEMKTYKEIINASYSLQIMIGDLNNSIFTKEITTVKMHWENYDFLFLPTLYDFVFTIVIHIIIHLTQIF